MACGNKVPCAAVFYSGYIGFILKTRKLLEEWRSPLGLCLAAIHAAFLITVIAVKPPMPTSRPCTPEAICFDPWTAAGVAVVANRPFHFHYEVFPVKLLIIGDTPALLITSVTTDPILKALNPSREAISYLGALAWLCFGSLEWWIFGAYLSLRRRRGGES
jgi:hypothetical protein